MTETYHTRERDPQIAAKRLIQPGERIISNRGHNIHGKPSCSIQATDGSIRLKIVSAVTGDPTDD